MMELSIKIRQKRGKRSIIRFLQSYIEQSYTCFHKTSNTNRDHTSISTIHVDPSFKFKVICRIERFINSDFTSHCFMFVNWITQTSY